MENQLPEEPCRGGHKINGRVPGVNELNYDGVVCDCGRVKFVSESCGCVNNPHNELKQKPNE